MPQHVRPSLPPAAPAATARPAPRPPGAGRPRSPAVSSSSPAATWATRPPAAPSCWWTGSPTGSPHTATRSPCCAAARPAAPRLPRGVGGRRRRPFPARAPRVGPPGRRLRSAGRGLQRHAVPGPAVAPRPDPVPGQPRPHRPVGDALSGPGRPARPPAGALGAGRHPPPQPDGRRLRFDGVRAARPRRGRRPYPAGAQRCRGARRRWCPRHPNRSSWPWAGSSSTSASICCCACGNGCAR